MRFRSEKRKQMPPGKNLYNLGLKSLSNMTGHNCKGATPGFGPSEYTHAEIEPNIFCEPSSVLLMRGNQRPNLTLNSKTLN